MNIANNSMSPPQKLSRWRDLKSDKEYFVFDSYTMGIDERDWYVWLVELRSYIGDEPVRFIKVTWEKWIKRTEETKSIKMICAEKVTELIS
jgi:hypothetical protein